MTTIRRRKGRIIFDGEKPHDRWSFSDPVQNEDELERQRRELTDRGHFKARELISDYIYLILDCPTTELACKKLRLIRRALRDVEVSE